MTFAELKAELVARGFQNINDAVGGPARIGMFINWARQRLDNLYLWPYREDGPTGVAPLIITDLGTIEAVVNVTQGYQISPSSYQTLLDIYGDLSQTGTPAYFYVGTPGGVPEVATVPTSTDTIGVQHWKRCPNLVDDSDTPLAPEDFHLLIVDLAQQRAYLDTDNAGAAGAMQAYIDGQVQSMVDQLLGGQQTAGPQGSTSISDASSDW